MSKRYYFYLACFKAVALLSRWTRGVFVNLPLRVRGMAIGPATYMPRQSDVTWPHKMCIGNNCVVNGGFVFREYSPGTGSDRTVTIGDNNYIDHQVKIIAGAKACLQIGSNNFIGAGSLICPRMRILIGNNCQLAAGCALFDFNHGTKIGAGPMASQICAEEEIVLEDDVWLGTGVTVLKGVTIGSGAVIGSGSVVTKSIPPYEIWAGVPAKKIGARE